MSEEDEREEQAAELVNQMIEAAMTLVQEYDYSEDDIMDILTRTKLS